MYVYTGQIIYTLVHVTCMYMFTVHVHKAIILYWGMNSACIYNYTECLLLNQELVILAMYCIVYT